MQLGTSDSTPHTQSLGMSDVCARISRGPDEANVPELAQASTIGINRTAGLQMGFGVTKGSPVALLPAASHKAAEVC